MKRLLDQWGNPVDLARLREEQAGPTLTGVRQVISEHPAQGLDPRRLAQLLRAAEEGDAVAYLELAEDLEEKDLHYRSVIGTRKLQVANLPVSVEAATDDKHDVENADMVRELMASPAVQHALYDVLDAVGKGFSVCEIMWDASDTNRWHVQEILWRPPVWFEFDRADGRTILLRGEGGVGEPLAPFRFIRHVHRTKSGFPIRGGLARPVAWAWLFKNFGIKDWVIFAEAYGHPLRVGKYDHQTASARDKEVLLSAVRNIATDAGAIIPKGMDLEFIEAKIAGNIDLFERLVKFLDNQVSKGVLGQTGTADSGPYTGTAEVQAEVREDIEKDDARQLAATLGRDLIKPYLDLNRKEPQRSYPVLRIGRPDELDVAELRDSLKVFVPMGLKVGASTVRDRLGLPDPDPDEDILGGPKPEPPPEEPPPEEPPAEGEPEEKGEAKGLRADGLEDDDWEPIMMPLADQLEAAFQEATDFEDLKRRLDALAPDLNVDHMAEHLGRVMAMAEAAGRVGAKLGDD